jgi:dihydrofolate reductase
MYSIHFKIVEQIHQWLYGLDSYRERHGMTGGTTNINTRVLDHVFRGTGAIIVGRRMFDVARGWDDDPPFRRPVFVITHKGRPKLTKGTTVHFVTDGLESTLEQAKAAAGNKAILAHGGANIVQQYLNAGLMDEIPIHLIPLLLGDGIRLFDHLGRAPMDLEISDVIEGESITHLRFRVVK